MGTSFISFEAEVFLFLELRRAYIVKAGQCPAFVPFYGMLYSEDSSNAFRRLRRQGKLLAKIRKGGGAAPLTI